MAAEEQRKVSGGIMVEGSHLVAEFSGITDPQERRDILQSAAELFVTQVQPGKGEPYSFSLEFND